MDITSTLFDHFNSFYYELLKHLSFKQDIVKSKSEIFAIHKHLRDILNAQLKEVNQNFLAAEQEVLKKGIYLETALADEVFLRKEHIDEWETLILEHDLFKTQNAGETVIKDIEEIIRKPQDHPKPLIELYLLVLSLGFKGSKDDQVLSRYKEELRYLLNIERVEKQLFPEATQYTNEQASNRYLLDVRIWVYGAMAVVLVYILLTTIYWQKLHHEITKVTHVLEVKTRVKNV